VDQAEGLSKGGNQKSERICNLNLKVKGFAAPTEGKRMGPTEFKGELNILGLIVLDHFRNEREQHPCSPTPAFRKWSSTIRSIPTKILHGGSEKSSLIVAAP
jgi:hypothetical protein